MEVRPKRMKPPAGDRPLFQGTAEEVVKDIRTYADLGVSHFIWDPTHQDLPSVLDNLKRFAHDVAPRFNRARGGASVGAGGARSGRNVGGLVRGARGSASAGKRSASAGNRRASNTRRKKRK